MAKILLIDDSEEVRDMTTRVLGREHTVYAVENFPQAFPYIFRDHMDLVLIDVNMPGIQGDKIAEGFRHKVKKPLKIVLFSAMDEADLKRKAKEVGADGFITKTFGKALLARVRQFLTA